MMVLNVWRGVVLELLVRSSRERTEKTSAPKPFYVWKFRVWREFARRVVPLESTVA
jgi:hypothetical protein